MWKWDFRCFGIRGISRLFKRGRSYQISRVSEVPYSGSVLNSEEFSVNWSGEVVEGVEFGRCRFVNSVFDRTAFRDCVFEDCEFESCDLTLATIAGSAFNPVIFRGCKLNGIAWHQAGFSFDAAFLDSQLDYSSFFGMKLNKTKFTGSRLTEVTFVDAVLREAKFTGCDLTGTVFNQSDLSRADFSGARNYAIDVRQNQVKGAVFEVPEALNLLTYFGVKIK